MIRRGRRCVRREREPPRAKFAACDPARTACRPLLQVAEGMACAESSSATGEGELVYLMKSSDDVPNLMVHTIGFGREADQALLKLLAKAGEHEGRYVYADH